MKKLALLLALVLMLSFSSAMASDIVPTPEASGNPVATVEQGTLMGFMKGETYSFLGVPYAKAGRFEFPQKPDSWEGTLMAQTFGEIAPIPQQTEVGYDEFVWPHRYWPQNENMQSLNIWTQSLDATAKKPVIVFMHGGGHTNGSSIESAAYDGYNLSEYGDVVFITLNHRLNALGYLDLSNFGVSPNLGVSDLVAALQWINTNIEQFGGDPGNVTIMGQSGGGGKVESVLHSPAAEGLVHRAVIVSSGGANMATKPVEDTKLLGDLTVAELGLDASTFEQIKEVPYADLLAAVDAATIKAREQKPDGSFGYGPWADGEVVTLEWCDWAKDIPIMWGSVFSESGRNTLRIGDGNKNAWTEEETLSWLTQDYGDNAQAILDEFKVQFPERKPADAFFYNQRSSYKQGMARRAEVSEAPVYNYLFTYEAPVNGGVSAFHCVDLIYFFHNVEIPIVSIATGGNADALKLQDVMATALINFATTGDPSQDGYAWAPYTAADQQTMVFDTQSGARELNDDKLIELVTAE